MGFKKIYISRYQKNVPANGNNIEIIHVGKIENLVKSLFT